MTIRIVPFLFIFLCFFSSIIFSTESSPSMKLSRDLLQTILNETIHESFYEELELNHIFIGIKNMPKKYRSNTFLQIGPKKDLTIFRRSHKRHYFLEVNPSFYQNNPGELAIRAILRHELQHVVDYLDLNFFQLGNFAIKYSSQKKYRYGYERNTDIEALKKGAGWGLAEYRIWLYKQISSEDVKMKKKSYLTPEEIKFFIENENKE